MYGQGWPMAQSYTYFEGANFQGQHAGPNDVRYYVRQIRNVEENAVLTLEVKSSTGSADTQYRGITLAHRQFVDVGSFGRNLESTDDTAQLIFDKYDNQILGDIHVIRNISGLPQPPDVSHYQNLYYVENESETYTCIQVQEFGTEATGTFEDIPTRADFHVYDDLGNPPSFHQNGDFGYSILNNLFAQASNLSWDRVSPTTALAASLLPSTSSVIFMGQFTSDAAALSHITSLRAGATYFYLLLSRRVMRRFDNSSYVAPTAPTVAYEWFRLANNEVSVVPTPGSLPPPGEDRLGQMFYVQNTKELRICIRDFVFGSPHTGTFNNIAARTDLHIVTRLSDIPGTPTIDDFYYARAEKQFVYVIDVGGNPVAAPTDGATALADSVTTTGDSAHYMGTYDTDFAALARLHALTDHVEYFYFNTDTRLFRLLNNSTYTQGSDARTTYVWQLASNEIVPNATGVGTSTRLDNIFIDGVNYEIGGVGTAVNLRGPDSGCGRERRDRVRRWRTARWVSFTLHQAARTLTLCRLKHGLTLLRLARSIGIRFPRVSSDGFHLHVKRRGLHQPQ